MIQDPTGTSFHLCLNATRLEGKKDAFLGSKCVGKLGDFWPLGGVEDRSGKSDTGQSLPGRPTLGDQASGPQSGGQLCQGSAWSLPGVGVEGFLGRALRKWPCDGGPHTCPSPVPSAAAWAHGISRTSDRVSCLPSKTSSGP